MQNNGPNFSSYNHPMSHEVPADYAIHPSSFSASSSSLSSSLRSYENRRALFPQFGDHHTSYHSDSHSHSHSYTPPHSHSSGGGGGAHAHGHGHADSGSGDLPSAHPAAAASNTSSTSSSSSSSSSTSHRRRPGPGAYRSEADDPTLPISHPSRAINSRMHGNPMGPGPPHAHEYQDRKFLPPAQGHAHHMHDCGTGRARSDSHEYSGGMHMGGRMQRHRASFSHVGQSHGGMYGENTIYKQFVEDMEVEIERLRAENSSYRHETAQLREKLVR